MKQDKQKTNWLIDVALFTGFLGTLWLDLTGVAVHQWLGLAVTAFSGYHLWKHWPWVKAVSGRLFAGAGGRVRATYLLDACLAAGLVVITATGVVISTWLHLALSTYAGWHAVHVVASLATLGLLVLKIGLHWRWIAGVARRRVFAAPRPAAGAMVGREAVLSAPARSSLGRRDFVRLMAGVGAVAMVSSVNALGAVKIDTVAAEQAAQTAGSEDGIDGTVSTSSDACTVPCNRRCSYPGHCRRYTDGNNNGRCDLGECVA